jgi:hypothetical protein
MRLITILFAPGSPDLDFAKTLYLYGPFAILALLVFVMEGKARRQLNEPHASSLIRVSIYVAVWLSIFVCGAITTWIWITLNIPSTHQIFYGKVSGLQPKEDFRSRTEMFVRRIWDKDGCDYRFVVISPKKLDQGYPLDLWIDLSTPDHEDPDSRTPFELPISHEYYAGADVILDYDRNARQLKVRTGNSNWTILKKFSTTAMLSRKAEPWWTRALGLLIPTAYAHKAPDIPALLDKLESGDVIVRVDARAELARMGASAIPYIEEILRDKNSSYRRRLGALVALNTMTPETAKLSETSNCIIFKLSSEDPDSTIREEAAGYIAKHPDLDLPADCKSKGCRTPFIELAVRSIKTISVAKSTLYVYLAGISTDDVADVYVIMSNQSVWRPRDGKLSKSTFQQSLRSLKLATEGLKPDTYWRVKIKHDHESGVYITNSVKFQLRVAETHYFKDRACLSTR